MSKRTQFHVQQASAVADGPARRAAYAHRAVDDRGITFSDLLSPAYHTESSPKLTTDCDMPWQNYFPIPEFWTKFQREWALILEVPEFSVQDRSQKTFMPKPSVICPFVSTEHRLLTTDRQTDTGRQHMVLASHGKK